MKPANFPGRKLLRRERALKRLKYGPRDNLSWQLEMAALVSRTSMGFEHARAIRTKKDRSATAKLARA